MRRVAPFGSSGGSGQAQDRRAVGVFGVAEPARLFGPKKKLVKAFDCVSKGTPHLDMFGVCVGFAESTSDPEVLTAIACRGPPLRLLLVRDGQELVFIVADPNPALAKRALSHVPIREGATPELLPFERRNLTAYVDL